MRSNSRLRGTTPSSTTGLGPSCLPFAPRPPPPRPPRPPPPRPPETCEGGRIVSAAGDGAALAASFGFAAPLATTICGI